MLHFAKFYEFLDKHNVTLISVSEGIRFDTKEGQMMYGLMISIASYEKEIIKERLMSGKITKAQKGL
jgi:DNA invertase Pin-like site-specific DNA recombinase